MVKIRLKRLGRKKRPFFRIVVTDSREKRQCAPIAEIGYYNPLSRELKLDKTAAQTWISKGALLSETVEKLYKKAPESGELIVLERVKKERLSKKAEERLKQEAANKEKQEAEAKAAKETAAAAPPEPAAPAAEEVPEAAIKEETLEPAAKKEEIPEAAPPLESPGETQTASTAEQDAVYAEPSILETESTDIPAIDLPEEDTSEGSAD